MDTPVTDRSLFGIPATQQPLHTVPGQPSLAARYLPLSTIDRPRPAMVWTLISMWRAVYCAADAAEPPYLGGDRWYERCQLVAGDVYASGGRRVTWTRERVVVSLGRWIGSEYHVRWSAEIAVDPRHLRVTAERVAYKLLSAVGIVDSRGLPKDRQAVLEWLGDVARSLGASGTAPSSSMRLVSVGEVRS